MRRLLILLFAIVSFGALVSAAPIVGAPTRHGAMAMPVSGCHDEGQCPVHVCLGCAMRPSEPGAFLAAPLIVASPPVAARPRFRADHRPGFDPPPPRRLG